ncbi:MAG: hypothetical protein ABSG70_19625 [Terriglobales bacterium]|jgi:hypothetical protein
MAASPNLPMVSGSAQGAYHIYHADAYILDVELDQPIKLARQEYGRVAIESRRESLVTQSVGETNIEGLISFKRGHTRVAGAHVKQKTDVFGNDHAGWVTLATAALEGYNVEDIITADRVVAQLSTQHSMTNDPTQPISHVPRVNFLGTRFENLRVGGYPVEVELDLAFCGPKPEGDRSYLQDGSFLDRVHRQLDDIVETRDLPESLEEKYSAEITYIDDLKKRATDKDGDGAGANGGSNGYPKLRCSLVKKIKLPVEIPGVRTFGNAIFIRDFGTIYLAELEVGINNGHSESLQLQGNASPSKPSDSNYFTLKMLGVRLGCPGSGGSGGSGVSGNGQSFP